ncbi:MAG: hypothetical protein NC218_00830 [Acetobacter sp.]|nr:hypothetical protein [Acetobacter sp.]
MLLYVDKKKQKRHRIKIITITITSILILLANILCFKNAIHHTTQHLSDYQSLQKIHSWYIHANLVYIFTSKANDQVQVITIPQNINKENSYTFALAITKIASANDHFIFSEDIKNKEYLQKIINLSISTATTSHPKDIIITTDINTILPQIKKYHLVPTVLNYQQTRKIQQKSHLQQFINQHFPPKKAPKNKLEQEKEALINFTQTHHKELQSIFTKAQTIPFTSENLLLQNAGVCLNTAQNTYCSTDTKKSLRANIQAALTQFTETPLQLILLTSQEEISPSTQLEADEGIRFCYGNQESIILPSQKQQTNNFNIYAYLKQQAGLNPEYYSEEMKFYKFKTTEIDINDNI